MAARRMAGNEQALTRCAEIAAVAIQPGARLQHLKHDILELCSGTQRVVDRRYRHAALDERRGDESLDIFVECAPIAAVYVHEQRLALAFGPIDIELLHRVG